jgi:hypothetical protein
MQGKIKRKDFAQFETLPLPYICVNILYSHSQKLKAKLFLIFIKKTRKTPSCIKMPFCGR